MPELPDVEVIRRRFAKRTLQRQINAVDVPAPRILAGVSARAFRARLVGHRFREARRHGKRLYCGFDCGGWVSMHFGLTGGLQFFRDDETPPFARAVIEFVHGERVAYVNRRMIGRIEWVDDMAADIRAKKLGPDALDPRFSFARFERVLAGRRGSIKSILMDQNVIAGIGNAYSDEILFQSRLHPLTPVEAIDARGRARLYRTLRDVLQRAIACGADPDRLPKNFLIPRRRAGEKCPRCGGTVQRLTIGGRSGYFCPRCQPKVSGTRRN
jgi:formamidopyrimidine-DNA glycosylase